MSRGRPLWFRLDVADEIVSWGKRLAFYEAHLRDELLGRAGAWLLNDLRRRLDTS